MAGRKREVVQLRKCSLLEEPPKTLAETMMDAELNHLYCGSGRTTTPCCIQISQNKIASISSVFRCQAVGGVPDRKDLIPDHVRILIPPKYPVARIIRYMKADRLIWIPQNVERSTRLEWSRGTGHAVECRSQLQASECQAKCGSRRICNASREDYRPVWQSSRQASIAIWD